MNSVKRMPEPLKRGELIRFLKTREVTTPQYGTPGSAGIDFFVPNDYVGVTLNPGESVLIPSGIRARLPLHTALIAMNKSGVATKKRLQVGACVVDCDYQGEIHIHVFNTGLNPVEINAGDKLVQFLLTPIIKAKLIECETEDQVFPAQTERGSGGFGSTGTTSL
jgi:dUTP pyrophosphatase